jgi:two-component system chemotaxis response regulator CheY
MPKAMVVDDSRAVRMILVKMLGELGYQVSQAGNGKEALSLAEQNPELFSLVLVDWNMPEMNGIDFVRLFRAQERFRFVPLVMVTTETEMEHVQDALEAGCQDYVMKPFTKNVILDKLRLVGVVE